MDQVPALEIVKSLPVRPLWLLRVFALTALKRVPVYAFAAGAALFLAAQVLTWAFSDGAMATAGGWSATILLTSVGTVLGGLAGLAAASGAMLQIAEADVRDWLAQVPEGKADRLFPTMEREQLQTDYEQAIELMCTSTIGRVPLPSFIRRRVQERFRQALLEDFLADCEQRGVPAVSFADLRSFLLSKALPVVTQPVHTQIRIWMLTLIGVLAGVAGLSVLIGLLANHVDPRLLVTVLGTAGVVVLGLGLPRASRRASPWRYRLGILILGGGLIVWPIAWIQLWSLDLGMVWIVVLAVTVWTFHRGASMAFLEGNGLVLRS